MAENAEESVSGYMRRRAVYDQTEEGMARSARIERGLYASRIIGQTGMAVPAVR